MSSKPARIRRRSRLTRICRGRAPSLPPGHHLRIIDRRRCTKLTSRRAGSSCCAVAGTRNAACCTRRCFNVQVVLRDGEFLHRRGATALTEGLRSRRVVQGVCSIASASAVAFFGGTRRPSSPLRIISGTPATVVETTGTPPTIASMITVGRLSLPPPASGTQASTKYLRRRQVPRTSLCDARAEQSHRSLQAAPAQSAPATPLPAAHRR